MMDRLNHARDKAGWAYVAAWILALLVAYAVVSWIESSL